MPQDSTSHLTVNELAALWRVSPTYVRREIWAGRLRSTRFGRAVRISRVEAARYAGARQAPNPA